METAAKTTPRETANKPRGPKDEKRDTKVTVTK